MKKGTKKITGKIITYKRLVKTKKKTAFRFYLYVKHNNGKKEDSNVFQTAAGRNKKANRLQKANPSLEIVRLGLKK